MKYDDLSFGKAEALLAKIGGIQGLDKLLTGEWVVGSPADVRPDAANPAPLLERRGEPVNVAGADRFVVRDKFKVDPQGELPLRYIGEDFTEHFLDLVEEHVPAATLEERVLLRSTVDSPIFMALGGEEQARVALAQVFAFLKSANRAKWFFFYATDVQGKLWAIDVYWRDEGWDLEAYSTTYPRGWRGGGRIVSHA